MPDVDGRATVEDIDRVQQALKESNEDRKRDKLNRQVTRAHEWRVQVWAQMELKIRQANASLEVLGSQPVECFEPQFDDDSMIAHYASMTLSK